mgnify:CR=1 FL=1
MNQANFKRAREIADASKLMEKAAKISARDGLTGAAAAKLAAEIYLGAVDQMAEEMQSEAAAERERCRAIITSPAAAQRPGMARKLALESNLTAAQAIEKLKGATLKAVPADEDTDAAANFILGAGHHDN